MKHLPALMMLLLAGCVGIPEQVVPVAHFKLGDYLGKWYEIARLDHRFERGLSNISADYSLRDDGGVRVVNRGYSATDGKWQEAEGKAYFVNGPDQAYMKVSFFGPFYGAYIVFELDQAHYQYALVSGPDKSYLWLLARQTHIPKALQDSLVAKAAALGFDTGKLIYTRQD
ncbi:MAG: lipocalin family protein [Methylovulum sp.]|nr:lipocalin family protein [Methylovulum sp.]